jgi:hypothetical protein
LTSCAGDASRILVSTGLPLEFPNMLVLSAEAQFW